MQETPFQIVCAQTVPSPPPPWWKDNSLRPIVTNAVQWRSRINRYNFVHFSTLVAF
jgi:hypothetical protein